jgi:hypothetical protein
MLAATMAPGGRAMLLEMARVWTRLADEHDRELREELLPVQEFLHLR